MGRMCDSFEKERWKGKSVAGDSLEGLVRWRKGNRDVVGAMNRCAKLIQRCPSCGWEQGLEARKSLRGATVEVGCSRVSA